MLQGLSYEIYSLSPVLEHCLPSLQNRTLQYILKALTAVIQSDVLLLLTHLEKIFFLCLVVISLT